MGVLQSQAPRKKDQALLGLGTGRGIQCGRGCPALGSQVRKGATATTPEPSILLVSSPPPAFDPLCSLRCRRLPTKADLTTPQKGLEMQQPLLHLHPVAQRAEIFLAGAGGPSIAEGGPQLQRSQREIEVEKPRLLQAQASLCELLRGPLLCSRAPPPLLRDRGPGLLRKVPPPPQLPTKTQWH